MHCLIQFYSGPAEPQKKHRPSIGTPWSMAGAGTYLSIPGNCCSVVLINWTLFECKTLSPNSSSGMDLPGEWIGRGRLICVTSWKALDANCRLLGYSCINLWMIALDFHSWVSVGNWKALYTKSWNLSLLVKRRNIILRLNRATYICGSKGLDMAYDTLRGKSHR